MLHTIITQAAGIHIAIAVVSCLVRTQLDAASCLGYAIEAKSDRGRCTYLLGRNCRNPTYCADLTLPISFCVALSGLWLLILGAMWVLHPAPISDVKHFSLMASAGSISTSSHDGNPTMACSLRPVTLLQLLPLGGKECMLCYAAVVIVQPFTSHTGHDYYIARCDRRHANVCPLMGVNGRECAVGQMSWCWMKISMSTHIDFFATHPC